MSAEPLPPPCEDLLGEGHRNAWCGDTDPTGRYVCRRVRDHVTDFHAGRNNAGGIHQWPVNAIEQAAAVPSQRPQELPYGVTPDDLDHDDVVTAKELWEAIRPQFDPNDVWEYTEIGPLLRTFAAVLTRRRAETVVPTDTAGLRARIIAELDGLVSEFIAPNEFGGYDIAYGELADIALHVVQPTLDHLAVEVERLRSANVSLLAMLERMETLHISFFGPDGKELHPDWCRECRVNTMRADRDAARRERDEMRQQRDLVKVKLGMEQGKAESATAAAERWMREAERLAIPATEGSFGQRCEELGRIPAGHYFLTIGIEVDDNQKVVTHFDVPGGINIPGYWGSHKSRIEPAPPVDSVAAAEANDAASTSQDLEYS